MATVARLAKLAWQRPVTPRWQMPSGLFIIWEAAVLAVAWWAAAALSRVGAKLEEPNLWLALGVYLAVVLRNPPKAWGVLALTVLATDAVLRRGHLDAFTLVGWFSDTLAVVTTALFMRIGLRHGDINLSAVDRHKGPVLLMLCLLPAIVSDSVFLALGYSLHLGPLPSWFAGFASRLLGIITVAPAVLCLYEAWASQRQQKVQYRALVKDGLIILALGLTALLSIGSDILPSGLRSNLVIYPVLLWIALFGRVGLTAAAVLCVALIVMLQEAHSGHLSFSSGLSEIDTRMRLQLVIAVTALSNLALSMVVAERQRATATILAQRLELERVNTELAAENRLRRDAEVAALQASKMKSSFLASVSHEIRSPLSAMLGFADLIALGEAVAEKDREYLGIIRRNGAHLLALINQILDLAKVEAGRIEPVPAPFDLHEFIKSIVSLMGLKAREQGLSLEVRIGTSVPRVLVSDSLLVNQILLNAVGNAIKFTSQGGVKLSVEASLTPQQRWRVEVTIEDSGIGISEEEKNRLFQPFAQANTAIAAKFGGTGLGLALSRHLGRLLGGDYELVSTATNVGSVFRLSFDGGSATEVATLAKAARSDKVASRSKKLSTGAVAGRKVLVADDSPDNLLLMRRLLEINGATVETALDGKAAVERALGGAFDILLLDLQMPHVDGKAAMLTLKAQGYRRPIVAVTASIMKDEIAACMAAGFDGHIAKPIDRELLLTTIVRLTTGPGE